MLIVLHGSDSFRITERYQKLRQAFIEKFDPQQLNVVAVDLHEADIATVHQHVRHQGLFVQKRFIGLRGIEQVSAKTLEQLIPELATLPDDSIVVCLIVDFEKLSDELKTLFQQHAKIESFPALNRAEVERWVRQRMAMRVRATQPAADQSSASAVAAAAKPISSSSSVSPSLTTPALHYLVEAVGNDLWLADNVIAQLVQVVGDAAITPEIVQRYCASPLDENIFHLTDAIAMKNSAQALALLHDQLASGANPSYVLTMLVRQIELLLQVKDSPTAAVGHPYAVRKAQQHAQRFSMKHLHQLHDQLAELDWQLKQSRHEPAVLLDRWVVRATTGN